MKMGLRMTHCRMIYSVFTIVPLMKKQLSEFSQEDGVSATADSSHRKSWVRKWEPNGLTAGKSQQ